MDPLSIASGALGLVGGIAGIFGASASNRRLSALLAKDPTYTANPLAAQRLALTQTLLNARAPGAAYQEANIYGNQANTVANINRSATSGSAALAAAAGAQGETGREFGQLGEQEVQDYQRRFGNYTSAEEGQINEQDKAYQDQVRRFQDEAQIRAAQNANTSNAWKSLSNLGFAGLNFFQSQKAKT